MGINLISVLLERFLAFTAGHHHWPCHCPLESFSSVKQQQQPLKNLHFPVAYKQVFNCHWSHYTRPEIELPLSTVTLLLSITRIDLVTIYNNISCWLSMWRRWSTNKCVSLWSWHCHWAYYLNLLDISSQSSVTCGNISTVQYLLHSIHTVLSHWSARI